MPSPCHSARSLYRIHEKVLKLAVSTDASLHAIRGVPVVIIWLSASCREWHEMRCHSSVSHVVGEDMRRSSIELPCMDSSSDEYSGSESEASSD